jgi:hypothetical protein
MRTNPQAKPPRRRRGETVRPPDHLTIEEWGKTQGIGRTASFAAVRRGEVPVVTIGGRMWVPPDWREQLAALALAEMQQKRQRHAALLEAGGRARAAQAEAAAIEDPAPAPGADLAGRRPPKGHRPRRTMQHQSGQLHTV